MKTTINICKIILETGIVRNIPKLRIFEDNTRIVIPILFINELDLEDEITLSFTKIDLQSITKEQVKEKVRKRISVILKNKLEKVNILVQCIEEAQRKLTIYNTENVN